VNAPALPDYIQGRQSRGLAERVSQNLGTSSPPYLSLKDNRFTLVDAAGNEQIVPTYEMDPNKLMRGQAPGPYCDVVIIDVNNHLSRIFYDQDYDPTAQSYQPPACFSHNGVAPSKLASAPQSPTCAACPNSAWGSATSNVSGKGIPACAQYQLVAVLVAGHDMPFLLRIPPNSLKNYRAYAEQFRGRGFDMEVVFTRLSFVSQGTLVFIPSGWPPKETIALSDKLFVAKATDAMVGRLDAPIQGMLPGPNAAPAQVVQQPVFTPPQAQQPQPSFAQPAAFQPMPMAPAQTQPAQPAAAASPSNPAPSGRGRRRNTAAAQPAAPQQAQPQPSFVAPPAQPNGPTQTFGMSPGVPPNAEVSTMLDNMFGPAK
jgi:hypothetical protein